MMTTIEGALEAILFTLGDPVDIQSLARAVDQDKDVVRFCLLTMQENYKQADRGLMLLELDNCWQLCTKKEYYETLIRLAAQPKRAVLTDVMLETLSIIAYKQPVTKADIEKIRGVKSDHAVNRLIEYDLVKELGRLDAPGRPILLGTTTEFLRRFGVSSVTELPEPDTVQVEDFRAEAEAEVYKEGKVSVEV